MTREEILTKIEIAKKNKVLSEEYREKIISMYQRKLMEIEDDPESSKRDKKNLGIIHEFYLAGQTFVTKDELISKGFDFSQWFTTSNLRHFFDVKENSFKYEDFKCGGYYIKTRDKNLEKPEQKARLFFQIIKLEFDRNTAEYKRAIKLLHDRKFASGNASAYRYDVEMRNNYLADQYDKELLDVNMQIESTLPHLKRIIDGLSHTVDVFTDLYERLQKKQTEDERWV